MVRPLLPAIMIRLVAILQLELCSIPVVTVLCSLGKLVAGAHPQPCGLPYVPMVVLMILVGAGKLGLFVLKLTMLMLVVPTVPVPELMVRAVSGVIPPTWLEKAR